MLTEDEWDELTLLFKKKQSGNITSKERERGLFLQAVLYNFSRKDAKLFSSLSSKLAAKRKLTDKQRGSLKILEKRYYIIADATAKQAGELKKIVGSMKNILTTMLPEEFSSSNLH